MDAENSNLALQEGFFISNIKKSYWPQTRVYMFSCHYKWSFSNFPWDFFVDLIIKT